MKFLIIPGYAKSGTTFLYEQLAQSGAPINLPKRKELDYFRSAHDFKGYLEQFETQDPDKVFLDASPLYALPGSGAVDRIKSALNGHDVKILFCLREPLARAYSHYMHDISTHIFLYAHGPYSFYSPAVLKNYFHSLSESVGDFNKAFGKKNVFGFGFKSTGAKLADEVVQFLDLPKDWTLDFSVNPAKGGSIPRIHYDADRHLTIRSGRDLYALPPRTFLMASIRYPQIRPDFPANIAAQFLQSQASWDRHFDPNNLGQAIKPIREDYLKCFDKLGLEREVLSPPKSIFAKEPPGFSPEICGKMERLGSVTATVLDGFRKAQNISKADSDTRTEVATDKHMTFPDVMDVIANTSGKSNGHRTQAYQKALLEFGPIPSYVQGYLRHLVHLGDGDKALKYLQENPNLSRYVSFRFVLEDLDKYEYKFTRDMLDKLRRYMNH
jgi:hypothetical protein